MPKTRAQKEELVTKLQDKLGKARSVVFADYKGLSMKQLSDLRDKLREQNAEFTITKNTLLERAMPAAYRLPPTAYQGPIATLFAYDDEISPIKILVKTLKDAAMGKIKMGFLGNLALDEMKIQQLAALPGKDELRGQTVGVLAAPLQGMVSVLQGNLRNLVYALNEVRALRALSEIQKMKGGE